MKALILSFVPLLIFCFFPKVGNAITHYIDFSNGHNSNNCQNEESPCQTFTADDFCDIGAGDIVNVTGKYDDGTVSGVPDVEINWNGSTENPITINAWPGKDRPILDGSSGFDKRVITFFGQNIEFNGFEIIGIPRSDTRGIYLEGAANIKISNNLIKGAESLSSNTACGFGSEGSDNINLVDNIFYNNSSNYVYDHHLGTFILNRNRIYLDSKFNGINANGFVLENTENAIIKNNFIYNFNSYDAHGIFFHGSEGVADSKILNNSFYNNNINLFVLSAASEHSFINNIIYGTNNLQMGIVDETGSMAYLNNLTSNYNDFYLGDWDGAVVAYPGGTWWTFKEWQNSPFAQDADSLNEDPIFQNLAQDEEDLHIKKSSSCRNRGLDIPTELWRDINVEKRPHGSAYDIGADEWYGYKPGRVTGVKIEKKNKYKYKVKLKWDKQADMTGYIVKLYNKKMKRLRTIKINQNKANKYIKKLKPGHSYRAKVIAKRIVRHRTFKSAKWSKLYKFKTKQ